MANKSVKVAVPIAAAGECRCCGVHQEGPLALKSRPKQPYYVTNLFTQERVACWWVLVNERSGHDIPVSVATVTYSDGSTRGPSGG